MTAWTPLTIVRSITKKATRSCGNAPTATVGAFGTQYGCCLPRCLSVTICFVAGWLFCSVFPIVLPFCFTQCLYFLGTSSLPRCFPFRFFPSFHFFSPFRFFSSSFFLAHSLVLWLAYVPPPYSLRSALHGHITCIAKARLCFVVCEHRARLHRWGNQHGHWLYRMYIRWVEAQS